MEETAVIDEDNDQSKPLLGDDYLRNDEAAKTVSKAKVAEYLPKQEESLGIGLRLLRGLYGHLPREDVPRIFWVSTATAWVSRSSLGELRFHGRDIREFLPCDEMLPNFQLLISNFMTLRAAAERVRSVSAEIHKSSTGVESLLTTTAERMRGSLHFSVSY